MKTFSLSSVASAILLLCVIAVNSAPANTGGQSAADAEREAWKKIREQTADFLAHEREYVMSQAKPLNGTISGQEATAEKAIAAVNLAPVAAAPESAATTLPPVTTAAPTNSSSTSVGSTADAPQQPTTTPASA